LVSKWFTLVQETNGMDNFTIRHDIFIFLFFIIYINIFFSLSSDDTGRRSQWPRDLRRRSAAARLLRSWVRIAPRAWMFACCECCVLSGRGLCDELTTRTEESYRLWCVVVCDLETSRMRKPWPALGRSATKKKWYRTFQPMSISKTPLLCPFQNKTNIIFLLFIYDTVSNSNYYTVPNVWVINPLNTELNPICYLLALLGAHHFLHVSRIRVKSLTLRLLMSYIYIYMTLVT